MPAIAGHAGGLHTGRGHGPLLQVRTMLKPCVGADSVRDRFAARRIPSRTESAPTKSSSPMTFPRT